jgi:GDP-D-mannose dehydratase
MWSELKATKVKAANYLKIEEIEFSEEEITMMIEESLMETEKLMWDTNVELSKLIHLGMMSLML